MKKAVDDYKDANSQALPTHRFAHDYAFSKFCWQYRDGGNGEEECNKAMQQEGYPDDQSWWSGGWNTEAGPNPLQWTGTGTQVYDNTQYGNDNWGRFRLCVWNSAGSGECDTGEDVHLDRAHPNYLPPASCDFSQTVARPDPLPDATVAYCPAEGVYAPTLNAGVTLQTCASNLIPTPGSAPAATPTRSVAIVRPPTLQSHYDVFGIASAAPGASACPRAAVAGLRDVLSADECTAAAVEIQHLPSGQSADVVTVELPMAGDYAHGFRCVLTPQGVMRWTTNVSGTVSYTCTKQAAPSPPRPPPPPPAPYSSALAIVNGYVASDQIQSAQYTFNEYVPNATVSGGNGFQRTDVGLLRSSACGTLCAVDDRISSDLLFRGGGCFGLSEARHKMVDSDAC
jgi:hypothetical protein